MKIIEILSYLLVTLLCICACSNNREKKIRAIENRLSGYQDIIGIGHIKEGGIRKATDFESIKIPKGIEDSVLFLKDIIEKVRYVKLESDTSCLIGSVDKLYFSESGRIIVVDKTKAQSIFIFGSDGMFINKIHRIGRGPDEYVEMRDACFIDDREEIVLYDDRLDRCLYFTIDGEFLRSERVGFFFTNFEYIGENRFVHLQSPQVNVHKKSIENKNIVVTENCKKILASYRDYYSPFSNIHSFGNRRALVNSGQESYYTPVFSDTVFHVNMVSDVMEANYCLDFGDNGLIKSLNKNISLDEYFEILNQRNLYSFVGDNLAVGDYVFFSISKGGEMSGDCAGFFSKKTKKLFCGMGYSIDSCADVAWYSFPEAVNGDELVSIIDPALVMPTELAMRENKSYLTERSPKLSKWLNSTTDMDNPILMFYTLKKF